MAEGQSLGVASSFKEDCRVGFQNDKATTVSEKGMVSLICFGEECRCFELHAHLTDSEWILST